MINDFLGLQDQYVKQFSRAANQHFTHLSSTTNNLVPQVEMLVRQSAIIRNQQTCKQSVKSGQSAHLMRCEIMPLRQ